MIQRIDSDNGYALLIDADRVISIPDISSVLPFQCESVFCVGYDGCLPNGKFRILPYGMGAPVPYGWATVPISLIPENLPYDFGAAMIRLAVVCGKKGVFFKCGSPAGSKDRLSQLEVAEMQVSGGGLKYAGSLWLAAASSAEGVSLTMCGDFRPLIVSGCLDWGTKAVYDGYVTAMRTLGMKFGTFEYDVIRKTFTPDMTLKLLLAECVDVRNKYTHLIAVDGLSIPPWLLDSCGLTTVLVSTEDPYSLDKISEMHAYYSHIFSNEKLVAEGFGVPYLPTAADPSRCKAAIASCGGGRDIDVCFIGALFPDRKLVVMEMNDICSRNGWKFFAGGTCTDEVAAELPYFVRGQFATDEMLMAIASSKVCLNIFRSPFDSVSAQNVKYHVDAASMNPRCYDASLCGAALLSDGREELRSVFGDRCIFSGNLEEKTNFLLDGENWQDIARFQSKKVMQSHTYVHRVLALIGMIEKGIIRF